MLSMARSPQHPETSVFSWSVDFSDVFTSDIQWFLYFLAMGHRYNGGQNLTLMEYIEGLSRVRYIGEWLQRKQSRRHLITLQDSGSIGDTETYNLNISNFTATTTKCFQSTCYVVDSVRCCIGGFVLKTLSFQDLVQFSFGEFFYPTLSYSILLIADELARMSYWGFFIGFHSKSLSFTFQHNIKKSPMDGLFSPF